MSWRKKRKSFSVGALDMYLLGDELDGDGLSSVGLAKTPPTVEAAVRQLCQFLPKPELCLPWTLLPGKSSFCSYLKGGLDQWRKCVYESQPRVLGLNNLSVPILCRLFCNFNNHSM